MTAVTIRPDGTSSSSNTTATGAATLHAATSDNSDASYALMAAGVSCFANLTMGTTALAAGAVVRSLTFRVRTDWVSSCSLIASDGVTQLVGPVTAGPSGGPITTYTLGAYSPTTTMSQAEVDGLLTSIAKASIGGFTQSCHEIYVDLVIALIPTTAATAPTGVVGSSASTATWTYTQGSDGDTQSHYRVKVYTSAEYGGGGFNPDTTPVTVYDSGLVLSASTSQAISGLPNTSTLRAYVQTSQTVNGIRMNSAWAFSGFTTSFSVSTVSSVVATPSNSLAKHAVVVNRNTGTDAWNFIDLQRSTDGVNWTFVRDGNHAAASGNTFSVDDYESDNGVATTYRARAYSSVTGAVGAWVSSSSTTWTSTSTWLKDPNIPARNKVVRAQVLPSPNRGRDQSVFYMVGRADPIVVSDVLRLRSGSISFTTTTAAEATDLLTLFGSQVLLLQTPASHSIGSMYLVFIGDVTENRAWRLATIAHRYFAANFVEVLSPADT